MSLLHDGQQRVWHTATVNIPAGDYGLIFQTDYGENRGAIELTEIDEMGIALFKRIFTYFKPDK